MSFGIWQSRRKRNRNWKQGDESRSGSGIEDIGRKQVAWPSTFESTVAKALTRVGKTSGGRPRRTPFLCGTEYNIKHHSNCPKGAWRVRKSVPSRPRWGLSSPLRQAAGCGRPQAHGGRTMFISSALGIKRALRCWHAALVDSALETSPLSGWTRIAVAVIILDLFLAPTKPHRFRTWGGEL